MARYPLEAAARDVRYALRVLRRTPAFTVAAATTLGLAIGINAAVFSVVDAVLLRPLPYPAPERLGQVLRTVRAEGLETSDTAVDGRTWQAVRDNLSAADPAVFSTWTTGVNLVTGRADAGARAHYVRQQRVGSGFFKVLGVPPVLGRGFTLEEDRPGGPRAAILAAHLWRTVFGADPSILEQSILLRGEPYTVVGVMPDGFQSGVRTDVWTPLRPSTAGEGAGENYHIVLRLADQVPPAWVESELARLGAELQRDHPPSSPDVSVSLGLVPLQKGLTEGMRRPLLLLWSAVTLVLVVACVNLAGLMLARAAGRAQEIATRLALGSGRTAVIRQLLVESLLLGVLGGSLGVIFGVFALDALEAVADRAFDLWQPVTLDARATSMAAALSLAASVLFGIAPAAHASRVALQSGLVARGGRSIAGGRGRLSRRILVVTQVTLGAVLLVGAGLLVRTFSHLRTLEPGFDAEGVITAAISLEDARYRNGSDVRLLYDRTLTQLRQTPGIETAAVALGLPYQRLLNLGFRHLDGSGGAAAEGRITSATYVTTDFFRTMRIPVTRGRAFDHRDVETSPPVLIVSSAFARTYFAGEDPLGRRILLSGVGREIVGVVGDVLAKPGWGDGGPLGAQPLAYLPVAQVSDGFLQLVHGWFEPTFVVRSPLPLNATGTALRRALDEVDPLLPFADIRSMSDVKTESLAEPRLLMTLVAGLALATLLLTAVGIHGLIATSVVERTREIGIRLALGAGLAQVMRAIAYPGVGLAMAGTATGLLTATATAPLVRHFVWGVSTTDPLTFLAVTIVLLVVASAASVLPTVRILRLDPASTLRHD